MLYSTAADALAANSVSQDEHASVARSRRGGRKRVDSDDDAQSSDDSESDGGEE